MIRKVLIIDSLFSNHSEFYLKLVSNLKEKNIDLSISSSTSSLTDEYHLILLADPIDNDNISNNSKVLGQRTLNRKERLEVVDNFIANLTTNWVSIKKLSGISKKISNWNSDHVVFKKDSSYGRREVYPIKKSNIPMLKTKMENEKDIFMEYINYDPWTYKVDVLGGTILNSWVLKTKNLFDDNFMSPSPAPTKFNLSDELKSKIKKLGVHLLQFGVGYSSFDFMLKDKNNFKLIELNTCSVGRNITWQNFPKTYNKNYTKGIERLVSNIDTIPNYSNLKENFKINVY